MANATSKKFNDKDSADTPGRKGGIDQARSAISPGKADVSKTHKQAKRGSAKGTRSQ